MARVLHHACSRLDKSHIITSVEPLTIAKLLQQAWSLAPTNGRQTNLLEPTSDSLSAFDHLPRVEAEPCDAHDGEFTFRNLHGGNYRGGSVFKQWRAWPEMPRQRIMFEGPKISRCQENREERRIHRRLLGPLATMASRSVSAKAYSSKYVRPEFETLFTKLPGMDKELPGEDKLKKVTVVGIGNVGMACAQTILTDHLSDAIALVDVDPDKLRGEMLDLQHAAAFMPTVSINADVDYKITANSDVCIVTAGARQREGEDRLSLVDRNVQVFKQIVPKLVKYSPNTILIVISNPVDILSWVTWKLSGLPPNRVIGSGTNLDSSRFQFLLANHFRVSAQNVHAHILGEHGDSSVPVWSSVRIAGVPVTAFLLNKGESTDPEILKQAHKAVVDGAYEVIKLKGYTSWAIGYSAAGLVSTILRNQRRVHPVSVMCKGFHGINQEVYLSLPAMLGRMGVHAVVNSEFNKEEIKQLHESAAQIWDIQSKLKL